jgi:hypothetical protein
MTLPIENSRFPTLDAFLQDFQLTVASCYSAIDGQHHSAFETLFNALEAKTSALQAEAFQQSEELTTSLKENAALQTKVAALRTQAQQDSDTCDALRHKISDLNRLTAQDTPATHSSKTRMADPPIFKGDAASDAQRQQDYRDFKKNIELKLELDGHLYNTTKDKIRYVASRLAGDAYGMIEAPIKNSTRDTIDITSVHFKEYTQIFDYLGRIYDAADRKLSAEREMNALKQGNLPFMEFFSKFNSLLNYLKWNDAAKVSGLRARISTELDAALVGNTNLPGDEEFAKWSELLVKLSDQVEAHKVRLKSAPAHAARIARSLQAPVHAAEAHNAPGPDPMELDAARLNTADRLAQKMHRLTNGLCLYCGGPGHTKNNCPELAAKWGTRNRGRGSPHTRGYSNFHGRGFSRNYTNDGNRNNSTNPDPPATTHLRQIGYHDTAPSVAPSQSVSQAPSPSPEKEESQL